MSATMPTHVVKPFDLTGVQVEHLPGIFCDFGDIVSAHIASLRQRGHPLLLVAADFFQHLLETVDHDAFRRAQIEFVSPRWLEELNPGSYKALVKYVDPIVWFTAKMIVAIYLDLHRSEPRRILDIGTGPGHFPAIAGYFGHDVTATERPWLIKSSSFKGRFFSTLSGIYGIRRAPLEIRAFEDMPAFDERFDVVTALLAGFDVSKGGEPWGTEAWDHFMIDVRKNLLTQTGRMHLSVDLGKVPRDVWAHIQSRFGDSVVQPSYA